MNLKFFLSVFSLFLIVFSIINFTFSITGFATRSSEGVVNLTLEDSASLNFITDYINFGEGMVDIGEDNASVDTRGNVIRGNWTPTNSGFILENIGNNNLTVSLKSGKTAEDFLGGTNPGYNFQISNNEGGSCSSSSISFNSWYPVNITDIGTSICNVLEFNQSRNSLRIDVQLIIPSDSSSGLLTDVFTATANSL